MIKKISKSNEGFSLIEMLVAVLVTAIMMLGVGIFISTSNVTFQKVTVSSKLQEESGATNNFLSEIMIEAVAMCETEKTTEPNGIKYWVFKSMDNADAASKLDSTSSKVDYDYYIFMLTNPNGDATSTLRYVKVDESDELTFLTKLTVDNNNKITGLNDDDLYAKYIKSADASHSQYSNKYNVIAQCIDTLNIAAGTKMFNVNVKYKYISTEYESNFTVNSRNSVMSNWPSPTTT